MSERGEVEGVILKSTMYKLYVVLNNMPVSLKYI